jgi:hypothetical protein
VLEEKWAVPKSLFGVIPDHAEAKTLSMLFTVSLASENLI